MEVIVHYLIISSVVVTLRYSVRAKAPLSDILFSIKLKSHENQ